MTKRLQASIASASDASLLNALLLPALTPTLLRCQAAYRKEAVRRGLLTETRR